MVLPAVIYLDNLVCPQTKSVHNDLHHIDSLVHDNTALKLLVDVMGEDRVILGTDYPFPLGEVHGFGGAYPGKAIVETYEKDEKMKRKLLFDNACDFLNLDPTKFL